MFPQIFPDTTKQYEAFFSFSTEVMNKMLDSAKQIAELNAKLLSEPAVEFNSPSNSLANSSEKSKKYLQNLLQIVFDTQAEMTKAGKNYTQEINTKLAELYGEISKNAPAGTKDILNNITTLVKETHKTYEDLTDQTLAKMKSTVDSFANSDTATTSAHMIVPATASTLTSSRSNNSNKNS